MAIDERITVKHWTSLFGVKLWPAKLLSFAHGELPHGGVRCKLGLTVVTPPLLLLLLLLLLDNDARCLCDAWCKVDWSPVEHTTEIDACVGGSGVQQTSTFWIINSSFFSSGITTNMSTPPNLTYRRADWQTDRHRGRERKRHTQAENCLLYTSPSPRD